mgnify:CR=1 FL=1
MNMEVMLLLLGKLYEKEKSILTDFHANDTIRIREVLPIDG